MDDDDRAAILAAMYQNENDEAADTVALVSSARTRRIRVGSIDYEVPSVEYMAHLEQMLARQAILIEHNQTVLDRLVTTLSRTRHLQQGFEREIKGLRRELANKISQRNFP